MKTQTTRETSWGHVAPWYHALIEGGKGTYQKEVILPHLLRLIAPKKGDVVADLACGQGFFSRALYAYGARVHGIDIAPELIALAQKETARITGAPSQGTLRFDVASADKAGTIASATIDKIIIVLALQNIANVQGVFKECRRILKPRGRVHIVLNHPAFRIPKASSWGWDTQEHAQYRRIDAYLSESKVKIQMHPGDKPEEMTVSFHRPLQYYIKALGKHGLMVSDMEEWVSHKKNEPGSRAAAENLARKEIPLFLFLQAVKV